MVKLRQINALLKSTVNLVFTLRRYFIGSAYRLVCRNSLGGRSSNYFDRHFARRRQRGCYRLSLRNLDPSLRFKGVLYGAAGAILLRVILIAFAVTIMNIPFLKLVGALLLLWIGIKLIVPQDEGEHEIHASKRLWGAIKTIIVADLVMSLDNVIAIAGAAEQAPAGHQMGLVIFGLLVSVPFILGGSQLFLKFIDRYPIIVYAGGALLGWIAGTLIVGDPGLTPHIPNLAEMHTPAGMPVPSSC